jgi:hypothetical protein
MIAADQRLAAPAVVVHDAATAGADVVIPRVTRAEQDGAGIDSQGDAFAKLKRSGKESVARGGSFQFDGVALRVAVDGALDAFRIRPGLIRFGQGLPADGRQGRGERSAGRRDYGFGDLPRVLGPGNGRDGHEEECAGQPGAAGRGSGMPDPYWAGHHGFSRNSGLMWRSNRL